MPRPRQAPYVPKGTLVRIKPGVLAYVCAEHGPMYIVLRRNLAADGWRCKSVATGVEMLLYPQWLEEVPGDD